VCQDASLIVTMKKRLSQMEASPRCAAAPRPPHSELIAITCYTGRTCVFGRVHHTPALIADSRFHPSARIAIMPGYAVLRTGGTCLLPTTVRRLARCNYDTAPYGARG
jgi:hypothetical protein